MKKYISKYNGINIVSSVLVFLFSAIIYSVMWLQHKWYGINYALVVYQINIPLKGTAEGVIWDYFIYVVPRIIISMLLISVGIHYIQYICYGEHRYGIRTRINRKEYAFHIEAKHYKTCSIYLLILVLIIGFGVLIKKEEEFEVRKYYVQQSVISTYYEDNYYDPGKEVLVFPEKKKNLILLFLESMETTYASVEDGGGKEQELIPNLVRIANDEDNISFSNTDSFGGIAGNGYGNIGWTIASILAVTSGIDYRLPGDSSLVGDYFESYLPGLVTLGDILAAKGYKNYFLCGSDGEFAGRKAYFEGHGYQPIIDIEAMKSSGYIPKDYHNGFWGVEDKKLYDIAQKVITDAHESGEPFNVTMLTVDTHHPEGYLCEECPNSFESEFANVINHADIMANEFLSWCEKQPWYNDTTIVILGDHNSMNATFWDDIGDYERREYNCIINATPVFDAKKYKNREATVFDMFPTILSSLGVSWNGHSLGLGVDLFSGEATHAETDNFKGFGGNSKYYHQKFIEGK